MLRRLAAVDLGSNSFRLEIGQRSRQGFERSDYLRETVRLGAGLDANGLLTEQAMQVAWDCLARFGRRLRGMQAQQVRAVATQTLREARNSEAFLARGQSLLGFPIEVLSGRQEAQLIYRGVAAELKTTRERRLVLDIGGRSTEIIVGQGEQAIWLKSLPLGSVAWSQQFFGDGRFTETAFDRAADAARLVLQAKGAPDACPAWDLAYGAAGTVNAVAEVLAKSGRQARHITRASLDWLREQLLVAGGIERLALDGLREDRKPMIGGGLSLLGTLMEVLHIEMLTHTRAGLRHGLLHSMMGAAPGPDPAHDQAPEGEDA